MALRNYNQRDFNKFNDPDTDVLGNKKPKKLAGENTSEIKMDKNKNPYALVLESTQSGLEKGDTIRPGKAPRVDNYVMGGDYTVSKLSEKNYKID